MNKSLMREIGEGLCLVLVVFVFASVSYAQFGGAQQYQTTLDQILVQHRANIKPTESFKTYSKTLPMKVPTKHLMNELMGKTRQVEDQILKEALVATYVLAGFAAGDFKRATAGYASLERQSSAYIRICDPAGMRESCSKCSGQGRNEGNCSECRGSGSCKQCQGSGVIKFVSKSRGCANCAGNRNCGSCDGRGRIEKITRSDFYPYTEKINTRKCLACDGKGRLGDGECRPCSGGGQKIRTCSACGGQKKVFSKTEANQRFRMMTEHVRKLVSDEKLPVVKQTQSEGSIFVTPETSPPSLTAKESVKTSPSSKSHSVNKGIWANSGQLKTIDLIKYINLSRDVILTEWRMGNGKLKIIEEVPHDAALQIPLEIAGEYDFECRVETERANFNPGAQKIRMALPTGTEGLLALYWEVDHLRWGGPGTESFAKELLPQTQYHFKISVRQNSPDEWACTVFLDGIEVLNYLGGGTIRSSDSQFSGMRRQHIYIGGGGTRMSYSDLKLTFTSETIVKGKNPQTGKPFVFMF